MHIFGLFWAKQSELVPRIFRAVVFYILVILVLGAAGETIRASWKPLFSFALALTNQALQVQLGSSCFIPV